MIHYLAELTLWMAGLYLAGCALGALARQLWQRLELTARFRAARPDADR